MSDISDKLAELRAQHSTLLTDRQQWDGDWKNLAKHFLPRKSRFVQGSDSGTTNKSALRNDVLDGAGIRSRRTATAGMHGGMTSPARPWFRLTLMDEGLAVHKPVRLWLDEVERRMRNLFARSNFYQAIHSFYDELITFGTDFMFETTDERSALNFNSLTVGEYCLDINDKGVVDTIFRSMEMTARNIVRQFGYENCSETVKKNYDLASSRLARSTVVHAILPNEDRDPSKLNNQNFPFSSYYYEESENQKFLRNSGYKMLPGFGVRWDVTGQDTYGGCPAMDSLGDIRMLQSVWATYLKQEHKRADPPMAIPQNLTNANTLPGAVNPVNTVGGNQAMYAVQQVVPDPSGILEIVRDVRASIREGMYNDLFRMLAFAPTRQMTATEVAERHEEKLLQLGPVLERLHAEGFIPLVDRTFYLMVQEDMIPPWPDEISGMPLKVDFVSLLAQAQKMVATSAVDQYMGFIANAAGVWPEMADIPDVDQVGESYGEYLGVETRMIRSREDREARREARNQAAMQQQQLEQAASGAQTAKTLADTEVSGGESSALDELMAGM